jgi:prevent-host-death family protein
VKPISYLKAHTAEIVRSLTREREPLVITQNGEAKVVIQDIESYEQTQETMALLILFLSGTPCRQLNAFGDGLPAISVINEEWCQSGNKLHSK